MKIGILTHPLRANYGGILQCYALCTILKRMGHRPVVIDRRLNRGSLAKRAVRAVLKAIGVARYNQPQSERGNCLKPFIDKKFEILPPCESEGQMKGVCKRNGLDAVIVGSDQVWRRDFALKYGYNYFLDFVPEGVPRLSYAASLGLGEWEYTPAETKRIGSLLKKFKGISVREKEGAKLVNANTGLDTLQHLDPTLLLDSTDYDRIAVDIPVSEPYVFVYWLGDPADAGLRDKIAKYSQAGYSVVELYLRNDTSGFGVGQWIGAIRKAQAVLTDSFHGAVFASLYSKPFSIHHNKSGGVSRITSLLNIFGVEGPEVPPIENPGEHLKELREAAERYLTESLNPEPSR